jgi:hypothetical protein
MPIFVIKYLPKNDDIFSCLSKAHIFTFSP